jgi:DnaA family protein
MTEPVQLSLGITLNDESTFSNFFASSESNQQAIAALKNCVGGQGEKNILVWGAPGSGLTHLLQAVCHEVWEQKHSVQYLPLRDVIGFSAEDICEGLEDTQYVCLDGIDLICGIKEWERSLFHLYNNIKDAGHFLLISAHTSPPSMPLVLPDLRSRVLGCMRYHIESLNDNDKQTTLILRAAARGLELPGEVARYILSRASRDTNELFNLLNKLDEASLQKQRKLTIPFVKDVLHL